MDKRIETAPRTVTVAPPYDDLLNEQWKYLQDTRGDAEAHASARGYVFAFYQLGLLNDLEHEAWRARFETCPDGESECHAPMSWCNYCGDVSGCPNGDGCCRAVEEAS